MARTMFRRLVGNWRMSVEYTLMLILTILQYAVAWNGAMGQWAARV